MYLAIDFTTYSPFSLCQPIDGSLMFQQVPMVEIDGIKLVQTRAILNYIASKYGLYGKDVKERALYGGLSLERMTSSLE